MHPARWVQFQQTYPNQWSCAYYGYGHVEGYNYVYNYTTQPQDPKMYNNTPLNTNCQQQ